MATLAPDALRGIYRAIRASGQYRSMREGGIVGDLRHQRRGGYHISRQDQSSSSNYSIQAPADKRGPANIARGIDLTMSPADMRKMTQRLMDACKANDPRIECVREFFGTLNGRTVTGWNRYPSSNRGVGLTSSDPSHLWHVHISIFTDYADDPATIAGLVEILLGSSTTSLPKPDEGDDVSAADVWDKDLKLGPGTNSAGWYMREILKQAKAANARTMLLVKLTETVLAKLVPDDPELQADLKEAIREELAAVEALAAEDDEEPEPESVVDDIEGSGPDDPYAPPHETHPK